MTETEQIVTIWDKYFSTPEKAAMSIADHFQAEDEAAHGGYNAATRKTVADKIEECNAMTLYNWFNSEAEEG